MTPWDMYTMPTLHFLWYLAGLSEKSNWARLNEKKERGSGRASRHRKR